MDKFSTEAVGPASGSNGSVKTRYKDMGDGTHALVIATVSDGGDEGGGGTSGPDRELVVVTYIVKTAFTGASVGDTITQTQIIDVTDAPAIVATLWRNQSTAADLVGTPSAANLTVAGVPGLTDAQLRATSLAVTGPLTNTQFVASAGGPTTAAWDGAATGVTATVIGILKGLFAKLPAALGLTTSANALAVVLASDHAQVPISLPDVSSSGAITAINTVPAGVAPAGSAVEISPGGRSQLNVQVTGVYTGALSLQGTIDGVNWVTIAGLPLYNVTTAVQTSTIGSAVVGIFTASISGFVKVRATALAAVTGSATVTLNCSANTDMVALDAALPTGGNTIGSVIASITPTTTSGFTTNHTLISAATTNSTLVKATSGTIGAILLANTTASWKYFKLYSKATAPTVGTDTPVMVIPIPPNGTREIITPAGIRVSTGIGYGITGAVANADTTAVALGDVVVGISYV